MEKGTKGMVMKRRQTEAKKDKQTEGETEN